MKNWFHLTWLIFHKITLYTVYDRPQYYYDFFYSFTKLIPCGKCKKHYKKNIEEPNKIMQENLNKINIFEWMIDIHNDINKEHNKKIWSYEESYLFYEKKKFEKEHIIEFLQFYIYYNKNKNKSVLIKMIYGLLNILPSELFQNKYIDFLDKNSLNENNIEKWFLLLKDI